MENSSLRPQTGGFHILALRPTPLGRTNPFSWPPRKLCLDFLLFDIPVATSIDHLCTAQQENHWLLSI